MNLSSSGRKNAARIPHTVKFTFCTTVKCWNCYILLNTCILKIIEENTCYTDAMQLQALLWRKCLCSQSHRHGMCPSFPVPQNHIFAGFSSSVLPEAQVNLVLQCIFQLSLVGKQLQHYFFYSFPLYQTRCLSPCFCEMLNVFGCFFNIWNHTCGYEWRFLRCWGDGLLLSWGDPFLTGLLKDYSPH